jgi:hypothetical protein
MLGCFVPPLRRVPRDVDPGVTLAGWAWRPDRTALPILRPIVPADTTRIRGIGGAVWTSTCYHSFVENRTEPRTARQWVRYIVVALIALFLVWWMLRLYVL